MSLIKQLQCKLCEHAWYPRQPKKPKVCPQCGSVNWETGRKRPPIAEQQRKARERRKQS